MLHHHGGVSSMYLLKNFLKPNDVSPKTWLALDSIHSFSPYPLTEAAGL